MHTKFNNKRTQSDSNQNRSRAPDFDFDLGDNLIGPTKSAGGHLDVDLAVDPLFSELGYENGNNLPWSNSDSGHESGHGGNSRSNSDKTRGQSEARSSSDESVTYPIFVDPREVTHWNCLGFNL